MKIAFYKGNGGWYNRIVRWWDNGIYSHAEIVFNDGMCASSSYRDGGVRFKRIEFIEGRWDFIELPASFDEAKVREWFLTHVGQGYDLMGNVRFLFDFMGDDSERWFCIEAIAESLGFKDSWRYSPNILYSIILKLSHCEK